MCWSFLAAGPAHAEAPTVAVLDFELNDLTLEPNTPEELERTASIRSSLQQVLAAEHGYRIAEVDSDAADAENQGFGYLFEHHDVAAQLGRDAGADWVIAGRVHKATPLFVYFKANVVNARTGMLAGELIVEVKGPQKHLTIKGVESLAEQIATIIE